MHELSRDEIMEAWWKVYYNLKKKDNGERLRISWENYENTFAAIHFGQGGGPLLLHLSMFLQCIRYLGSEEQQSQYLGKGINLNIIGCYAQTELGHGSNVAGLETTATLDKTTDEFVIHTPNIKATKFWPGALGVQATHAVVYARMIIEGAYKGIHPFIVPIRSLDDHQPLPGIKVGDLGTKMGYNFVDNGWLSFD